MSRIKTLRGVELRSTVGMRKGQQSNVWLITMNRAQAKIWKWDKDSRDLVSIKSWAFPDGKKKGSDLISDQPGRVFNSRTVSRGGHQTAAPRHSYGNKEKPQTYATEKSVRLVCDWFERNSLKDNVTDLVCVAEPKLMGMIQKRFKKHNGNPIIRKWERDFGWLSEEELRGRLLTWLSAKPKPRKRFVPRAQGTHGVSI